MKFAHLLASAAVLVLLLHATAPDAKSTTLIVQQPHARPTVAGQTSSVAYMTLLSPLSDQLLSATTPVARSVELHSMVMQGDVMKMRELVALELPANQPVMLKPGGHHLMLLGLVAPLKEGSRFALKLKFQHAGWVTVQVPVTTTP